MPVVALASKKGGVGKTTVALNLSLAFAHRGWRTLLVDADPLGCIGLSVERLDEAAAGLVTCLEDGGTTPAEAVRKTRVDTLDLLPVGRAADPGAGDPPERLLERAARDGSLEELVHGLAGDRDLVLLDTASGLTPVGLALVGFSDHVLIPIQSEPLALRTTHRVLDAVGELRSRGSKVRLAGFLLTMVSTRDDVCLQVAQEAWGTLPSDLVLEAFVPRDPVFLQASAAGVPVGLLASRPPPVASVFDQIAAELEPRLGLLTEGRKDDVPIPLLD